MAIAMSILDEIGAERVRQVSEEGWTPEHDDQHGNADLARAAAAYAIQTSAGTYSHLRTQERIRALARNAWPWAAEWFKPRDARRDLIKAGALIVAEIERLDRAAEGVSNWTKAHP